MTSPSKVLDSASSIAAVMLVSGKRAPICGVRKPPLSRASTSVRLATAAELDPIPFN